ncbi:MAG: hypothetical protein COB51_00865 [Moraxellaceae bacterium]|nr:MAG: hypothetical protein COB51_00865 [Moraxellaceae bacterium]
MSNSNDPFYNKPFIIVHRDQGVILVATLVFLLLIGMLGLSSLDASITQEKMIGSSHHHNLASQAAETALVKLENQLINEGVGGTPTGLQLINLQLNSQDEFSLGSDDVHTEEVKIGGLDYFVTQKGGVSDNPNYVDSNRDWGASATAYEGIVYGSTDSEVGSLSAQPKVLIEQGVFIPDDLSVEALTEFRGRQEFLVYSQAISRNERIASVIQSSVLVRAQ